MKSMILVLKQQRFIEYTIQSKIQKKTPQVLHVLFYSFIHEFKRK